MAPTSRASFGSRIGAILASAGSAVGLGNIWRFPTQAGENGGAAFILVYVLCVLLMGMPVMISEFIIGRRARANTAASYRVLAPGTRWVWVGRLGVLTGFLILSYYAVVAGWTLEYTVASLIGRFNGMGGSGDFTQYFARFTANPVASVAYTIAFLVLTHVVVARGVQKGIERSSKIFMPLFFLLLIVLVGCALTMPGAGQAMQFLFTPDFSKIDSGVVLAAMGQAFFSLSLGMGCLCTYASYFGRNTRLGQTALSVGAIDTIVAVMAGIMIFPAVFSVEGVGVDAGPSLLFITLPSVFHSAFGGMPLLGYLFALCFYVLLVLATLTSTISLHEVVTAYLVEEFGHTRQRAAIWVTAGCTVLGALCALSMGVLKPYTIAGFTLFDLFDFVTAKLMLPIGAFFICLFVGWKLERHIIEEEVTNGGMLRFPLLRPLVFLIRYIVPVLIALIFLNELGASIF